MQMREFRQSNPYFLVHKAPKMMQIGYEFNTKRKCSWKTRFDQLKEYQHGNVEEIWSSEDEGFVRWLKRLKSEGKCMKK